MAPKQKPLRSKQDYATPARLIRAVEGILGIRSFIVDLAADENNHIVDTYIDKEQDSLTVDWSQFNWGWSWLNPEYKHIEPWVQKSYEESLASAHITVLVPASVGANWWRDWVHEKAKVLFLNGRVGFIPDKPKWLYPKDLALLLYSNKLKDMKDYQVWTWS